MRCFATLATLVAAVAAVAIPAPDLVRNSERLARRLPPLPPKFGRTLPGHVRGVDEPTPARVVRPRASPAPVSYTGRVEVRYAHGAPRIGYLEHTKEGFDHVNAGSDADLHVSFKTYPGNGPFDIRATKHTFKGPAYLGGVSSKPSPTLSAESAETVGFASVEKTARHAPPVNVTGGFGESAIWSFNPSTKKIAAHWINPDGSHSPTVIAYDAKDKRTFFVGSIDAYNEAAPSPATAVEFFLANDS